MPDEPIVPDIVTPDYEKMSPTFEPTIPEDFQEKNASEDLIDKVKRITIKGKIDVG